jgi:sugar lactone lactonase YvrE
MRIKYLAMAAAALTASGIGALGACGSGDDVGPSDASMDTTAADGAMPDHAADAPPSSDSAAMDGGMVTEGGEGGPVIEAGEAGEAAAKVATFLVHFNQAANQLPEGLWELQGGLPIVGLSPLATLVTVPSDGGAQPFGSVGEAGTAANSNTLGIVTDVSGNVYVGVGSFTPDAGPVPAPGVYKFAPDGGEGVLFSSASGMNVPNGLDFFGTRLFVADSEGSIFVIDSAGNASVWSSDPLLAPDPTACDGGIALPIGANGIVHANNTMYVTNTNHGRIVSIPIEGDGGAGAAATVAESCSALLGADGVTFDSTNGSLIAAVNVQNKIVRVNIGDGGASIVTSGGPLDFPASVFIDTVGGQRRLLFTNAAFFSPPDAGRPGLLAFPLQ